MGVYLDIIIHVGCCLISCEIVSIGSHNKTDYNDNEKDDRDDEIIFNNN